MNDSGNADAGSSATADDFTSRSQRLYAFGSNGSGQLGLGHTEDVNEPQLVCEAPHTRGAYLFNMCSGGNHTLAQYSGNNLSYAGKDSNGRGFGSIALPMQQASPSHMALGDDTQHAIATMSATWSASVISTEEGQVLSWGFGPAGELGLGPDVTSCASPTIIPNFPPPGTAVKKLVSCVTHTIAILTDGDVWGWGQGRNGQLGSPAAVVWQPRKIEGMDRAATDAACGKDFTCIFGSARIGQRRDTTNFDILGLEFRDRFGVKAAAPRIVPPWRQVGASWGSVYVLCKTGELLGWGRNDHGQLPPPGLPPLQAFAAGSEHVLGLTTTGKVLAWGWGEHGNCGQPVNANGDVCGNWNEIALSSPAIAVFAGCATSFIHTGPGEQEAAAETNGDDQSNRP